MKTDFPLLYQTDQSKISQIKAHQWKKRIHFLFVYCCCIFNQQYYRPFLLYCKKQMQCSKPCIIQSYSSRKYTKLGIIYRQSKQVHEVDFLLERMRNNGVNPPYRPNISKVIHLKVFLDMEPSSSVLQRCFLSWKKMCVPLSKIHVIG